MPNVLGDNIDRLVSIEIRPHGVLRRGMVAELYAAARNHFGTALTQLAAEKLADTVKRGDVVIIGTGHGHDTFMPKGETDGPLGAAVLARALSRGLGAVPVILCKEPHVDPIAACCTAVGLGVTDLERALSRRYSCAIVPLASEDGPALIQARHLWDRLQPKAVIAIEKLGPNVEGISHSGFGKPLNDDAKFYHFVNLAREEGALSVGIGDLGNELGFGIIAEEVRRINPFPQIVCSVATDVLVVAGSSNYGAYGVAAYLAYLLKRPEILHDADADRRMLEDCVRVGGQDGLTTLQDLLVDGQPSVVSQSIVELLQALVRTSLWSGVGREF